MKRFYIFFLFLSFFCVPYAMAQELQEDSLEYVREFPETFHLRLILHERPMYLQLQDDENNIEYRPNSALMVGLGANILDMGMAASFKFPFGSVRNEQRYGNTDLHDYQLSLFLDHFLVDMLYQDYTGFYMANTSDWNDRFVFDGYPLRGDVSIRRAAVSGLYLIDTDKLTLQIYNNARKQLRSAGSFVLMSTLNHFRIGSDELVIPADFGAHFSGDAWLRRGHFSGLALMPGYTQSFVLDDFYLNLTVAAGPELQYKSYDTPFDAHAGWHVQGKINIRGAVGYDNDVFFAGIHFIDQRNRYRAGGLEILHDTGFLRLSVGRRFPETRWMKKIRNCPLYQQVMNFF